MDRSIFRWMGGKNALGTFMINLMPDNHKYYKETHAGSAIVFLKKPLAPYSTLNDINGNLVNVYNVLRDEKKKDILKQMLRDVPYSRELFNQFQQVYRDQGRWIKNDKIFRALMYVYLNRVSFNGEFNNFSAREDSSPILELDQIVTMIHNKFRAGKVVVECKDCNEFLRDKDTKGVSKVDNKETFIYCDPPYWVTTEPGNKYYEMLMSVSEHLEFRDNLTNMKNCRWMLSYDHHPEVIKMYDLKRDKDMFYSEKYPKVQAILTPEMYQSSAATSEDMVFKRELLIVNYEIKKANTLFENE